MSPKKSRKYQIAFHNIHATNLSVIPQKRQAVKIQRLQTCPFRSNPSWFQNA